MADLGIIFLRRKHTTHIIYNYYRKYAVPLFLGHPEYGYSLQDIGKSAQLQKFLKKFLKEISLMVFFFPVHRVLWILQAMWIVLSDTIHILRILNNLRIFRDFPENFTTGLYTYLPLVVNHCYTLICPFGL